MQILLTCNVDVAVVESYHYVTRFSMNKDDMYIRLRYKGEKGCFTLNYLNLSVLCELVTWTKVCQED